MTWETVRFGDLYAEPSRNGVYKSEEHRGSGIKIVNMGELFAYDTINGQDMNRLRMSDAEMQKCGLAEGDLLFGRRSLVESGAGKCSLVGVLTEPTTFESSIIRVRVDKSRIRPRFLFYWLRSPIGRGRLRAIVTGTNVKGIRASVLQTINVVCPPQHIQDHIVSILSAYDDLIENNRRRIQLLEQAVRMLYREWFVYLRFPGHEHVKVTDGVPERWKRTTLSAFVDNGSISLQTGPFGTQLRASDYTEDGTPVINVRNIGYGDIRVDKLEYLPESKVVDLKKHILQAGDIVFGRKGAVDRHVLISSNQEGWVQGSDCLRLRVIGKEITATFLSVAFREDAHKQWMLGQCGNKATMASLNQDVILRIPVLVPAHELRLLFDESASRILSQIVNLSRQSEVAASARDVLLPRLMNGEIPV